MIRKVTLRQAILFVERYKWLGIKKDRLLRLPFLNIVS